MSKKKYTTEELVKYLENTDSGEEAFSAGSDEEYESPDYDEESSPSSSRSNSEWKRDVLPLGRETFTGNHGVQNIAAITELGRVSLNKIYAYFVSDEIIDEMVIHTNNYAHLMKEVRTGQFSRMTRWKHVSRDELKLFFGVIMYMGLNHKPSVEHYWKLDVLYYNPLMHRINMSYNRFSSILRCWHFTEVQIRKVVHNFRTLYTPADIIVVDDNPAKTDRYGMKIYKACTINSYTWSYQIYCDVSHQLEGLDKPGSIVVQLTKPLLDVGRIIVADDYYTSLPLAEYLKERKTDLCGTLRKNKRSLPKEVVKAKLRKGEQIVRQKDNLYTVLKWRDKRDMVMISTCHGDGLSNVTTKRGNVMKPDAIADYNEAKKGIDISDQLALFHSPLRESLTWYKNIAVDLLFQVAVINTRCIFNELVDGPKLTVLQVQEHLVRHFLGPAALITEANLPQRTSISSPRLSDYAASSSNSGHCLQNIPRNIQNRLVRKRCTGCYAKLRDQGLLGTKAKQVHTECKMCGKAFCLDCYNEKHQ